ncbi:MAG: pilus assembly protein TadG-related protein [Ilumatobacter sp.]|uniref:pilus assembly protein TadG-related protein n=1 Tax=Ilumatobacter sp. TaxID=1967498 RepID=UPI003C74E348
MVEQRTNRGSTASLSRHDVRLQRRDRGQAAVLVITVAAVLLVVIVLALATMGRTAVDRTRAQTAADAAALASLDGGRPSADSLAEQHGAAVVSWFRGPGTSEVTVTVRLGDTTATARASNAP